MLRQPAKPTESLKQRTGASLLIAGALLLGVIGSAHAAAEIGQQAPDFALKDLDGKEVKLADYRGKTVVLEWYNPECPFVRYAHTKGPLASMGNRGAETGVVWLAINSSAPGKQGNDLETNRTHILTYDMKYPVLRDEDGAVGRRYEARTTPHVFVVNGEGVLVYRGALDNAPLGDVDGEKAINYVELALADLQAKRAVATSDTRPYGCSVKYAN